MTRKHILPAGIYFIGDPCYLIPDADWDKVGDATNWFGADHDNPNPPADWDDGLYHWNEKPCFASNTRYGDGVYFDGRHTQEFWVDSGLIGVTPFDGNPPSEGGLGFYLGGKVKEYDYDFEVWAENGVFHIDKMKIDTN